MRAADGPRRCAADRRGLRGPRGSRRIPAGRSLLAEQFGCTAAQQRSPCDTGHILLAAIHGACDVIRGRGAAQIVFSLAVKVRERPPAPLVQEATDVRTA